MLPFAGWQEPISGTSCVSEASNAGRLRCRPGAPAARSSVHAIAGDRPNKPTSLLTLSGPPLDPYLDVVPLLSQRAPTPRRRRGGMLAVLGLRAGSSTPARPREQRLDQGPRCLWMVTRLSECHGGDLASFRWPVSLAQELRALMVGSASAGRLIRLAGDPSRTFERHTSDPSTRRGRRRTQDRSESKLKPVCPAEIPAAGHGRSDFRASFRSGLEEGRGQAVDVEVATLNPARLASTSHRTAAAPGRQAVREPHRRRRASGDESAPDSMPTAAPRRVQRRVAAGRAPGFHHFLLQEADAIDPIDAHSLSEAGP